MSKKFYLLHKKGYDPTGGAHGYGWSTSHAMIVVATSPKKAREATYDTGYLDPKKTVCKLLDIKNYKNGDVIIEDFGDDG